MLGVNVRFMTADPIISIPEDIKGRMGLSQALPLVAALLTLRIVALPGADITLDGSLARPPTLGLRRLRYISIG